MAQELQVVVTRHDAAMEKKQYAMHYADNEWQFRSMARRLGKPTPRAVNKVVVEGETLTDPHNVKRELDKWARKTNTSVYNNAQLAEAQAEYDRWLDKADIHVAPNHAAVERPWQRWARPYCYYIIRLYTFNVPYHSSTTRQVGSWACGWFRPAPA
jgi:hypothetical protein